MNKTELSSAVAKQANLTQAQAKAAVEATLDAIYRRRRRRFVSISPDNAMVSRLDKLSFH